MGATDGALLGMFGRGVKEGYSPKKEPYGNGGIRSTPGGSPMDDSARSINEVTTYTTKHNHFRQNGPLIFGKQK